MGCGLWVVVMGCGLWVMHSNHKPTTKNLQPLSLVS